MFQRHILPMDNEVIIGCLGSISPTFYKQLLGKKIPKVQKDSQVISVFLCIWNLQEKKLLVKRWWNWALIH